MSDFNKIMVLAPHPDDGEFGAGASLARWIEEGKEVIYVAFSPCTQSVPEGFEKDVLFKELADANKILGIKDENRITFDFDVRYFPRDRQSILEAMVALNRKHKPDLVLTPLSTDIHQDHATIYEESIRAFKHCSILGYELPWNNITTTLNYHVNLSKEQVSKKVKAVNAYASQGIRNYKDEEFLFSWAKFRGIQSKFDLAESFELIRWFNA